MLAPDVLLISDGAQVYRHFARDTGMSHSFVNVSAGVQVRGASHIQNVNGWHSRFKNWMICLRGVASRYLARPVPGLSS